MRSGWTRVALRRRNITDPRWLGVLEAVAQAAGWTARVTLSASAPGDGIARGRGIALGTHIVSRGAAVADVLVDRQTGEIKVTHLYGALDAGLAVNPALIENQIEGMLTQAASRAVSSTMSVLPSVVSVSPLGRATMPSIRTGILARS
jgi:CO/xanthine dehydrogenase Mo-binding subunit